MLLKIGRINDRVSDRSVYRPIGGQNYHGDLSVCGIREVEGWTLAAERTVYGLLAESIAKKFILRGMALHIILPEETDESKLKQLMKQIGELSREKGITVDLAEVRVSKHVNSIILTAAATKWEQHADIESRSQTERTQKKPAGDLVLIGTAGSEGAALLSITHKEELLARYTGSFLAKADDLYKAGELTACRERLAEDDVILARAVGEGGVFAALWELCSEEKCGVDVALKKVPIMQHTIEICEFFGLNPYQLSGGGAILALCRNGENLATDVRTVGIKADVIGKLTDNKDKIIRYDDEIRYLEPSKTDEIYKSCPRLGNR